MKIFKGQCLGGTRLDSQGEKVPKYVFEGIVETYRNKRQPLNQAHDHQKKSVGYIENIQLIEDPIEHGEWSLIGDVYCDTENLETVLGGFSISYLEITNKASSTHEIIAYLPYPFYNDNELMNSLQYNSHISVGRWVKKASDPATIALIGATTVFIIKPVWEDLYKTQLAPKIYKFVSENYDKLKSKNIGMDLIQTVNFNGNDIQIIMIPIRGQEKECYHVEYIDKAMKLVNLHLYKECSDKDVGKIYLYFHDYNSGFKLHKIELVNGEVIYYL